MRTRSILCFVSTICIAFSASADPWRALGDGLEVADFPAGQKSFLGDSTVTVLRIDPKLARFTLLAALQTGEPAMTAKAWAAKHNLRAVINAGMFGSDALPVGRMRAGGIEINPKLGSQNSIFVFDPTEPLDAKAQLLDRGCGDVSATMGANRSVLQSLRVIDCHGKITWSKQAKQWSMALLGSDRSGRILFIHCRSPYPVHDLAALLQKLPIDLRSLMYLEGGPEATLYIKTKDVEIDKIGSYETGFQESDDNDREWDLPNVIGVLDDMPSTR